MSVPVYASSLSDQLSAVKNAQVEEKKAVAEAVRLGAIEEQKQQAAIRKKKAQQEKARRTELAKQEKIKAAKEAKIDVILTEDRKIALEEAAADRAYERRIRELKLRKMESDVNMDEAYSKSYSKKSDDILDNEQDRYKASTDVVQSAADRIRMEGEASKSRAERDVNIEVINKF